MRTDEELERMAYINGHTEIAELLARVIDAEQEVMDLTPSCNPAPYQHTPGPWIVRDIPTLDIYVGPSCDGGATAVAIVPTRGSIGEDEQKANARLIAAAPDLLQALSILMLETEDDLSVTHQIKQIASAAIAKAIGVMP